MRSTQNRLMIGGVEPILLMEQCAVQPNENDPRAQDLGTYEMLWDCKFCGAEGLPARTHRHCPTCGAAQDPNTRRFPSDAEKKAVHDHVHKGADLICGACKTVNDGDAKFCRQCGAPLESAERAATIGDERRGAGEQFQASAQRDVAAEQMQRDLGAAQSTARKGTPWLLIGLGVAAAVICVGIVAALFLICDSAVGVYSPDVGG